MFADALDAAASLLDTIAARLHAAAGRPSCATEAHRERDEWQIEADIARADAQDLELEVCALARDLGFAKAALADMRLRNDELEDRLDASEAHVTLLEEEAYHQRHPDG